MNETLKKMPGVLHSFIAVLPFFLLPDYTTLFTGPKKAGHVSRPNNITR